MKSSKRALINGELSRWVVSFAVVSAGCNNSVPLGIEDAPRPSVVAPPMRIGTTRTDPPSVSPIDEQRGIAKSVASSMSTFLEEEGSIGFFPHADPTDPLARTTVALVPRDKLVPGYESPTFRAACLSNSLHEWNENGRWCSNEPRFDGPRLATASGVRVSSGWVLTTTHGLRAVMPGGPGGQLPVLVEGLTSDGVDNCAVPSEGSPNRDQLWTWPDARTYGIEEIHCMPDIDLALVSTGEDDGVWQVEVDSKTVKKLRKGLLASTPVLTIGHPLGVPAMVSNDGRVYAEPIIDGGHRSDVDDFLGSSGSPVYQLGSKKLLGLVGGAVGTMTVPHPKPADSCYWLPRYPLLPQPSMSAMTAKNARIHLVTRNELNKLRSCKTRKCQVVAPHKWDSTSSCK